MDEEDDPNDNECINCGAFAGDGWDMCMDCWYELEDKDE